MYAAKKSDLMQLVHDMALALSADPVGNADLLQRAGEAHPKVKVILAQRIMSIRFPIGSKVVRPKASQKYQRGEWTVIGYRGDKVRIKKGHNCENIDPNRLLRADVEPVEELVPAVWRVGTPATAPVKS